MMTNRKTWFRKLFAETSDDMFLGCLNGCWSLLELINCLTVKAI